MERYEYVQCLFCETGKEEQVVRAIHENGFGRAIFAQRIRFIKREKEWEAVRIPLLPGYVFLYLNRNRTVALEMDYLRLPHVFRVLKYDDGSSYMRGNDLLFSDWLWRTNGEIGVIKVIRVGDRIEVADNMLRALKGQIIHINRRQRKVYVTLDSMSIPIHTWLAYEQITTIDGNE